MDMGVKEMEMVDLTKLNWKFHQHYVPQFYLNLWMSHEGIHVKNSIGGKTKTYSKKTTVDVAVERYFYEIEMDDVVWNMLNSRFSEQAKTDAVVNRIMSSFLRLKKADDVFVKGIGIVNDNQALRENIQGLLGYLKKHELEDFYWSIETAISPEIEAFSKSQDSDLWVPASSETFRTILVFFCVQNFRTKEKISSMESKVSKMVLSGEGSEVELTSLQMESVMKCMLFILSLDFCQILDKAGCTITIFKNRTKLNYLTSDCPAMYFDKTYLNNGMDSFGLMPLSPKLLVHIRVPSGNLGSNDKIIMRDVHDVEKIIKDNALIEHYSHNFVFAKKKKDFRWSE